MTKEYLWSGESAYCKCGHHITRHVTWTAIMDVEPTDSDICCTANCPCQEFRPDHIIPNPVLETDDSKKYKYSSSIFQFVSELTFTVVCHMTFSNLLGDRFTVLYHLILSNLPDRRFTVISFVKSHRNEIYSSTKFLLN
jgi:hypothetical protein